jgi:hypothetical protein
MATQMSLERIHISFHLGEVIGGAMICHALLQQKQQHQIIKLSLQVGTCSLNRKQRDIYIYMLTSYHRIDFLLPAQQTCSWAFPNQSRLMTSVLGLTRWVSSFPFFSLRKKTKNYNE